MGYGRFAYTGILPVMLHEQILSLQQGNLAASVNYAGYLIGALLLAKARPADSTRLTLASVAGTLACLALLAWVSSPWGIILIRGLAGVLSAVTMIAASLWLLQHMRHHHGAPVLFSGVGMGIFLSAECISLAKRGALSSPQIWLICAASATILFLLVVRLLLTPAHEVQSWPPQSQALTETDGPTADAWRLLAIYGFSGFGYIITATYLPLFLSASLTQIDPVQIWALFGLAAVPSCFIWHKLVVKLGFRGALTVNLLIQAAGVVLPAFSQALLSCLLSALLVGFTFMGTVTIALPEARRLNQRVKFNMIAAMTATYGVGQIIGPFVAGTLHNLTGSFNPSLIVAAASLCLAAGACTRAPLKGGG
ncbi:YbfB/YjiJ family MFS transporter [Raoultella planticola]|nr:YbfB/YjiJ family MFS transporter [Raoultella planticola]MDV1446445.1 YbfB/YjiJ family MFS transporter [Raoultella planticola]MDV1565408.1 YbfB/YjiJ family MFS transporter [Raoultella planticola]MDV1571681.1 YbfB/YjiJ family MFS transporter [Raoultella planticola]MDV1632268.1 YbfB/YjiJ family MFS transporter [Raoultella planticola]MDW2729810.1 YbfB/YjiJ family MFS transporter [Raoultella planticola]